MPKEEHPYLHHFDNSSLRKYIIIGTFPPNKEEREGQSIFADYFYGNKGSLWSILKETHLFEKDSFKDIDSIKAWELKYSVGVTDVLQSCIRKEGKKKSSDDSDMIITKQDLNTSLKEYLIKNILHIDIIYFTSSGTQPNSNSAFYWFSILMGSNFLDKYKLKYLTKLPSPSGRYLTSKAIFSNIKGTHGLSERFLQFLIKNNFHDAINIAQRTYAEKQVKVQNAIKEGKKASTIKQVRFPDADNDYPSLFRIMLYKDAFTPVKENQFQTLKPKMNAV